MSVHYTTSYKLSLALLRMGEIIARNMLSWLKLLIKLLLLHLVGCLYYCIGDARSHKYQMRISLSHYLCLGQNFILHSSRYVLSSKGAFMLLSFSTFLLTLSSALHKIVEINVNMLCKLLVTVQASSHYYCIGSTHNAMQAWSSDLKLIYIYIWMM